MKSFLKLLCAVLLVVGMVSCGDNNKEFLSHKDFNAVVFMQDMRGKNFRQVDNVLKSKGFTYIEELDGGANTFVYTKNVFDFDSMDAELSENFEDTKLLLYVMFGYDGLYSLQLCYYGTQEDMFKAMQQEKDEMLRVMKATSPIVYAKDSEWYYRSYYNVIAEAGGQKYSNYADLVQSQKDAGAITSKDYEVIMSDWYAKGNLGWDTFEKRLADMASQDITIDGVSDWFTSYEVYQERLCEEMLYYISYRLKNGVEYLANSTTVFILYTPS